MKEPYSKKLTRLLYNAEEIMANHTYELLADTPSIEAYRCQRPNTTNYGFDIICTKFGISVVGDTDNLTFRVGIRYGIPFLAGDHVDFIYGKLDQKCQRTRLINTDRVNESALRHAWYNLGSIIRSTDNDLSNDAKLLLHNNKLGEATRALCQLMRHASSKGVVLSLHHYNFLDQYELGLWRGESTEDAARFLESIGVYNPLDSIQTEPSESQLEQLFMIQYAAKQILSMKGGYARQNNN